MAYTVFFKEANKTFIADQFIGDQPVAHQALLKSLADELSNLGTITHPQATKNTNGAWTVLLNENNDVYMYTLYVSKLEKEAAPHVETPAVKKQGVLVILDPSGPRDSIGGYHPGYWFVDQYVTFLDENQRKLFLHTIHQIEHKVPSENYSENNDGSVSIHIRARANTSTTTLTCRAEWV
jgi:hypothetical protein